MKYIISESQYRNIKEQFDFIGGKDFEEQNQFIGTQSPATLAVIDILLREGILEEDLFHVSDNTISIYGFPELYGENYEFLEYFNDNSIEFEVETVNGIIRVNVSGDDGDINYYNDDDDEEEYPEYWMHLGEIYDYIKEFTDRIPFVEWYFEGDFEEDLD
jgi:hypothetical protein